MVIGRQIPNRVERARRNRHDEISGRDFHPGRDQFRYHHLTAARDLSDTLFMRRHPVNAFRAIATVMVRR